MINFCTISEGHLCPLHFKTIHIHLVTQIHFKFGIETIFTQKLLVQIFTNNRKEITSNTIE